MAKDLFYSITVDATLAAYDLCDDVSSLTVDQREGRPDQLTVEMSDPFKVLGHALREGMDITVDLGTADDHAVIFRGRIYRVDGSFPLDDVPTLKLEAYDKSMKMGLLNRSRAFTNQRLSDIVRAVAEPYFGAANVNVDVAGNPSFLGNGVRQDDETDLSFLLRLARAYGCVAHTRIGAANDTFDFLSQIAVMKAQPAVTLHYGRCDVRHRLLSFHSSADVSDVQLPRVLSGIDPSGKAIDVTEAPVDRLPAQHDQSFHENLTAMRSVAPVKAAQLELLLGSAKGVQDALQKELGQSKRQPVATFTTKADLQAISQNQFSTSLEGMRASGDALGVPQLVACNSVAIEDVGGRFSKHWYLTQVRHTLNGEGYNTGFECRR